MSSRKSRNAGIQIAWGFFTAGVYVGLKQRLTMQSVGEVGVIFRIETLKSYMCVEVNCHI